MIIENKITGEIRYTEQETTPQGWKQSGYIIGSDELFKDRVMTIELTEGQLMYLHALTKEDAIYGKPSPLIKSVIKRLSMIIQ
jgi:hypothetical protein